MKKSWIVNAVFLGFALAVALSFRPLFDGLSFKIFDGMQKVTALQEPQGVAMVFLDQESLDLLSENEGLVFPLPRQIYGAISLVAKELNAKAIAFDILFTESSSHGVEDDQSFADLLNQSELPVFMPAPSAKGSVKKPTETLEKGIEKLLYGGVHLLQESDGVFRKTPKILKGANGDVLPLGYAIKKKIFPEVGFASREWLRFYELDNFPRVPLYNLLIAFRNIQQGEPLSKKLDSLRNKVWIVGYSAPGLHDLKPMATDKKAPGPFVHAVGLANLLDGEGLDTTSIGFEVIVTLALLILLAIKLKKFVTPFPAVLSMVGFSLFSVAGIFIVAWFMDWWWNPLPLLVTSFLYTGGLLSWKYQSQWKERMKLAKSLEASMSPEMVKLIRSGEVKVDRYGHEEEISILFSDLAGFTALTEKTPAKELVELLNDYFDHMVGDIVAYDGYVDKFIGDAIMAFWGAPVKQEKHMRLSIQSAAQMLKTVDVFNGKLRAQGFTSDVRCRIGIHTGKVVVGNIGAKKRHNFTVIGDPVNLAARLESLCKQYGIYLLISEDSLKDCGNNRLEGLLEVDQVVVKGRTQATKIYTVVERGSEASEKLFLAYESGRENYYRGEWQKACDSFSACLDLPMASVLQKRCKDALNSGSAPKEWSEGVWSHDSK